MKITEIVISDELKIFEYIKDQQIASEIYALYHSLGRVTDNFIYEHYEVFAHSDVFDTLNDLDHLTREAANIFDPNDQVMEVLRFLTDYFER
jgi:hypothetical protein